MDTLLHILDTVCTYWREFACLVAWGVISIIGCMYAAGDL